MKQENITPTKKTRLTEQNQNVILPEEPIATTRFIDDIREEYGLHA